MEPSKMILTGELGTDFWNDSCDLKELGEAIEEGAMGATSNPVIVCTVAKNTIKHYGPLIDSIIQNNSSFSEIEIAWDCITLMAKEAADLLTPVYERTKGKKGRLSVQVNPVYYRNPEKMIEHGVTLAGIAPNIAIKLPVTRAGLEAAEELTAKGVSVTATVSFTLPQAIQSAEAIERGLKRAAKAGIKIDEMSPSVVVMVGRLDDHLKRVLKKEGTAIDPGHLEWAGIAVFKKLYQLFTQRGYRSRLLSAAYRNHMQWSEFIGGDVVLTIPYKHWKNFNASSVEAVPRMDKEVDPKIISSLLSHFNDFKRAYEEDGMTPQEFEHFGSSVHTLNQFINGYYELLTLVRGRMLV